MENKKSKNEPDIVLSVSLDTSEIEIAEMKVEKLCKLLKETNSLIKELTSSEHHLKISIER